jgi:hypothetical protein
LHFQRVLAELRRQRTELDHAIKALEHLQKRSTRKRADSKAGATGRSRKLRKSRQSKRAAENKTKVIEFRALRSGS